MNWIFTHTVTTVVDKDRFFIGYRNLVRVHMMNPRCSKFECLLLACRTGQTFWRPSRWIAIILYVYGSFGDGRTVLVQGFSFSYQWPRKLFGTCTLPLIFLSGRIVRTNLCVQVCGIHYIEILKVLNTNTVIPRLTKIIRSGIIFVSRNLR